MILAIPIRNIKLGTIYDEYVEVETPDHSRWKEIPHGVKACPICGFGYASDQIFWECETEESYDARSYCVDDKPFNYCPNCGAKMDEEAREPNDMVGIPPADSWGW